VTDIDLASVVGAQDSHKNVIALQQADAAAKK
jgi:hypothetical protein